MHFTDDCTYANTPLGADVGRYDLGLNECVLPEIYLRGDLARSRLRGPQVAAVEAVWYFTNFDITRPAEFDGVPASYRFPAGLGGRFVGNCGGSARVYTKWSEALADLAKCDLGTGYVVQVSRGRAGDAKKLAALVLKGDGSALFPLADALAEQSHPLADQVRGLCEPPKKKRGKKK